MWPDHDPTSGARNLRVILSRLRQALEPGRECGVRPVLRADGDTVALADGGRVEVDVHDLAREVAAADRARAAGDATAEVDALEHAVGLWRGEPLLDLEPLVDSAGDVEAVRRSLIEAALRLGEVRLAAGRTDEALRCAERARRAALYDERAHRLVMAASLQRRDRNGALAAVAATEAALDEMGVPPEQATAMLIRQVRHRAAQPEADVVDLPGVARVGATAG